MKLAEVFWVELPRSAGRAQSGRRPAIIAQATSASDMLPTVLVVPLTTQLDALRFPGTVLVDPDSSNGLRLPSVALVFQMTVLDKSFLSQRLGVISPDVMEKIWSALEEITGRR